MKLQFKRKWPYLLLLTLILSVGIERTWHEITDGFSISKLQPHHPFNIPPTSIDAGTLDTILSQKYTYLACGSQNFAFESEDGAFVLKFFKHHRWRPRAKWTLTTEQKNRKRKEAFYATYKSCLDAYNDFQEETALIYLNLSPSNGPKRTLTVIDKIGRTKKIDLRTTPFALQKKVVLSGDYLLSLLDKGDLLGAQTQITALLNFNLSRHLKGYSDKDPHAFKNLGMQDGKVIQIDIGGFHQDARKNDDYFFNKELLRIETKMETWLQKNAPMLVPFMHEQVAQMHADRSFLVTSS